MADEKRNMKDIPQNKGENEIERVKREGAEAAGVGKEVRQGAGEGAKAPQEYLADNADKDANRAQAKGADVKGVEAKGKAMADKQETIKPAAGKKDDDYKQDLVPPIVGKTGQQTQAQQPKQGDGGQNPRR
ncbi:MAG: hypothetical protein ABI743_10150 [bacterium]